MSGRSGASLAEVALGTFIFAVFSLAILALLVRSKQLDTSDKTMSQVNSLSEALMEEVVMAARTADGFAALATTGLIASQDPDYVYALDVVTTAPGLKKVSLLLYYHDPLGPPTAIDSNRPNGALALCLGTALEQP